MAVLKRILVGQTGNVPRLDPAQKKDGYLCYEINDDNHRMVYHVKYIDGVLDGFYVQLFPVPNAREPS